MKAHTKHEKYGPLFFQHPLTLQERYEEGLPWQSSG